MMVFEDFTKKLVNRMETRLGKGYRIQVKDTLKNNSIVEHQLMLRKNGSSVVPAIYLQEQYELYMKQPDKERLDWIIENILASYEQQEKEMDEVSKLSNKLLHYEHVKDNILFKLINTEDNEELLMQVPHISYLDLSIVFYVSISETEQGIMTALIWNQHMEVWNVTAYDLYKVARKNTPERMPARFCSMEEMIFGLKEELEKNPIDEWEMDMLQIEQEDSFPPLYILSNTLGINGAAAILYPETLKKCSEALKKDLFILPSSTHEVLLLPYEEKIEAEELACMIRNINREDVPREDWLSDHAYFYRREDNKVTAA